MHFVAVRCETGSSTKLSGLQKVIGGRRGASWCGHNGWSHYGAVFVPRVFFSGKCEFENR